MPENIQEQPDENDLATILAAFETHCYSGGKKGDSFHATIDKLKAYMQLCAVVSRNSKQERVVND
jgi:hypothetical protein